MMFGGAASVSWHLSGVGPVVTSDVVDDSQPTQTAIVASSDNNTDRYRPSVWVSEGGDGALECIEA